MTRAARFVVVQCRSVVPESYRASALRVEAALIDFRWSARVPDKPAVCRPKYARRHAEGRPHGRMESVAVNSADTMERVPIQTDADGVIRVAGTRVTLDTLLAAFDAGATAEKSPCSFRLWAWQTHLLSQAQA